MKIKYLGKAAAEGVPSIFCESEACKQAMDMGGKYIRTRSQALINDDLLIDFPDDTYMHYLTYKFDWKRIKSCIITHSHQDYLYHEEVEMRRPGFAFVKNIEGLKIFSDEASYNAIAKHKIEENIIKNIRT